MESSDRKYSSEWEDDTKMTVLFSPFREKSLNPKSWEQKVMFWTEMIQNEGRASGEAILSLKSLPGKFERKGRTPVCLQTVIEEMIRNGKLKKLSDLQQQDSVGWLSWGFTKLIKQPIKWSFQLLPWQNSGNKEDDDLFVLHDILKEKMDKLIEGHFAAAHCDITDNILEYSELREQHRQLCPSDLEFSLVIEELARSKRVQLYSMGNNTTLVKFIKNVGEKAVDPVREQDLHILRIKKSHQEVTRQIEKLMKEVKRLTEEAKMYNAKDMIKLALSSLRKRRLVQKRIEKLTGSVELLEDLLSRIRQAHSDEKVLEAVKSGTVTLKAVTEKQSADSVAKFMDDLAELQNKCDLYWVKVIQEQDDIMSEMSFSFQFDVATQDELEAELTAILGEEEEEKGEQNMPVDGQAYREDEITAAFAVEMSAKCMKCKKLKQKKTTMTFVCTKCTSSIPCSVCNTWTEPMWADVVQKAAKGRDRRNRFPNPTEPFNLPVSEEVPKFDHGMHATSDSLDYLHTQINIINSDARDSRLQILQDKFRDILKSFNDLSSEDIENLKHNIKYAHNILFRSAELNHRRQVVARNIDGYVIQCQGATNYCGLCCINNALGQTDEAIFPVTIEEMDLVADLLWIGMAQNPALGVISKLEALRDQEGFYSIEVIKAVLERHSIECIRIHASVIHCLSPDEFVRNIQSEYSLRIFIIHPADSEHWLTLKYDEADFILIDSKKPFLTYMTPSEAVDFMCRNSQENGAVFLLYNTSGQSKCSEAGKKIHDDTNKICVQRTRTSKRRSSSRIFPPLAPKKRRYCICNMSDDGRTCDGCKNWYHPSCLGLQEPPKFYCQNCEEKGKVSVGRDYGTEYNELSNSTKEEALSEYLYQTISCDDDGCQNIRHVRHHAFCRDWLGELKN